MRPQSRYAKKRAIEDADHAVSVRDLALAPEAEFTARFDPDLLGGVVVLEGEGVIPTRTPWEGALYLRQETREQASTLARAIPYCVWDNRAPGGMIVWLPRA